jgi:integrase
MATSRKRTWGSLRKLPSGRFQARYTTDAGEVVTAPHTFTTVREANTWLATQEADLARGTHVDHRRGQRTLGDFAVEWFATKAGLKAKTRECYRSTYETHVEPAFGALPLTQVTPVRVKKWAAALPLKQSGQRQALLVLTQIMDLAIQERLIGGPNPVTGTRARKTMRREVEKLTLEQATSLVRTMTPGRDELMVATMLQAGLRWGELTAMRACDLDKDAGEIVVSRAVSDVGGKLTIDEPKSHQRRRIEISDGLMTRLLALASGEQLLFPSLNGTPLRLSNWRRVVWVPAVRSANVPAGLQIKDLRACCATWLTDHGYSIMDVGKVMGHSESSVTATHYARSMKTKGDLVKAMSMIVDGQF